MISLRQFPKVTSIQEREWMTLELSHTYQPAFHQETHNKKHNENHERSIFKYSVQSAICVLSLVTQHAFFISL